MFKRRSISRRKIKYPLNKTDLIAYMDASSVQSEQFRTLRTNIEYSRLNKDIKTLLISSSIPAEGKSLVSANLAYVMTQNNKKILLVDADLRRSSVHTLFNIDNNMGLTSLLKDTKINYQSAIQEIPSMQLSIIPAGPLPNNPSELLASDRMTELIKMFKEDFDLVIFDAPPIIAVTDALILASKVDSVILVSRYGYTKKEEVILAKEALLSVEANILGYIMNARPMDKTARHYYSY